MGKRAVKLRGSKIYFYRVWLQIAEALGKLYLLRSSIMNTELLYKALRKVPEEKLQKENTAILERMAKAYFQKRAEEGKRRQEQSEPLYRSFKELLAKNGMPKPRPHPGERGQPAGLTVPKPLRLSQRIVRHGSLTISDIPPFQGWVGQPSSQPGSNNDATAGGTIDIKTGTVTLQANAGEGIFDQNSGGPGLLNTGGGNCGVWADIGQYYSPPQDVGLCGQTEWQLQCSATPLISWYANWGSTWWATAIVDLSVHLVINRFDLSGNYIDTPLSTGFATIYAVDENQLDGWGHPWQNSQAVPLTGSTAVLSGYLYAFWVEFYAFAQANGTSNIGATSTADGGFTAVVPSITLALTDVGQIV